MTRKNAIIARDEVGVRHFPRTAVVRVRLLLAPHDDDGLLRGFHDHAAMAGLSERALRHNSSVSSNDGRTSSGITTPGELDGDRRRKSLVQRENAGFDGLLDVQLLVHAVFEAVGHGLYETVRQQDAEERADKRAPTL
jgi:hypothetical protein